MGDYFKLIPHTIYIKICSWYDFLLNFFRHIDPLYSNECIQNADTLNASEGLLNIKSIILFSPVCIKTWLYIKFYELYLSFTEMMLQSTLFTDKTVYWL